MPKRLSTRRDRSRHEDALRVLVRAPRIDLAADSPSVSVVIPAMNEARNLPWLAERMPRGIAELLLVDGRSVDGTIDVARSLWPEIRVIAQTRRGKGNALACGFAAARGEIVVMLDADGSMDPGEIPYFVAALEGGADFAKGSRFIQGGGSADITRFRAMGNHALNGMTRLVHRTTYTDLCYGYNAFWRRILPVLDLDAGEAGEDSHVTHWGDGFEVETVINIRVHLAGLLITEVASYETPRLHGASNLRAISDGCRVLRTIARERRTLRHGAHLRREAVAALVRPLPDLGADVGVDSKALVPDEGFHDVVSTEAEDFDLIDLAAYERDLETTAARLRSQGRGQHRGR